MKEEYKQPDRTLQFVLNGSTYSINFPNNRQYIAIQNMKAALLPHYDSMQFMGAESEWAQTLVDVEAHLTVLCPQLLADLTKSLGELSLIEGKEIVTAYTQQFRPWYNGWLNFIFQANKTEENGVTS